MTHWDSDAPDGTAIDGLLHRAMAASAVGMALLESDGRFAHVNHALIDLLRLDQHTLLQRSWQELAEPSRLPEFEKLAGQMHAGVLDAARLRGQYARPQGDPIWLDAAITAVRDGEGTLVNYLLQVFDVTEEVRAEQRYRLLAENGTDVVAVGNNQGQLEWLSPSVEQLIGWRPGEMVGTFVVDYMHPDDRAVVAAAQAKVLAGEEARFEARLKTREGGYHWISALVKPRFDAEGNIVGRIAGWRDFEPEMRVRRALRDSEHHLRLLAENASDVVYAAGLDRAVTWVSPNITKALGWAPEELIGRPMSDLLHPDDLIATEDARVRAYRGEVIEMPTGGFLTRIRSKYGTYHWVRSYSTRVTDADGAAIGLVAGMSVVDDLVEARERAEAIALDLTDSERRFRLLAENMTDVVLHTRDHVVQWASPSLTRTLGWNPEDWIGHTVRDFIHPDDHELVARTREAAVRGEDVVARARVMEPSGAYVWVEAHLAAYRNEEDEVDGVVVSIRVQGAPVLASRDVERASE